MRKFLKALINLNLVLFTVTPTVTACVEQGISLKEVATNLELGYLENLKTETILAAFAQKNPNVNMNLVTCGDGYGNSYKQYIYTQPPWNRGYKNSNVIVKFNSKLGFGNKDNNKIPILFTKKEQIFTIPIAILTDDYNPEKDDDFTFSHNSLNFNQKLVFDQENKVYNIFLSFEEREKWRKDFTYLLRLRWNSVVLTEMEINLNF